MNFFTNKIAFPASNGPSYEEWLARVITEQNKKVASEAKPDCDDDPRGQCRSQVINNDNENGAGYQKGESVSGKKEQGGNARPDTGGDTDQKEHKQKDKEASSSKSVKAHCGKEMGESKDSGKVTEKHTESGPGDDENPEPKILINNDPNYQKGESTKPSSAKNKKKKQHGKEKKSSVMKFEQVSKMSHKDKLSTFAMLTGIASNLTSLDSSNVIAYAESVTGLKYANMKEDEKKWFSDFWNILYPPDYVAEMVKDK